MDATRLQGILSRYNQWWQDGTVQDELYADQQCRRDFDYLCEYIDEEQVVTLCGPRQVGKSTMVGQAIDHLLTEENTKPNRILYFTTEVGTLSSSENIVSDVLSVYEERILSQSFQEVEDPVYVFIDEIQKVDDWADAVKLYVDRHANLTFVLTGSVSTLISRNTNETLVGRVHEQVMVPMKYVDYLLYKGTLSEPEVREKSRDLRTAVESGIKGDDIQQTMTSLTQALTRLEPSRPEMKSKLETYLLRGGYPGHFDADTNTALRKLDRELYGVVTGDIPSVYRIEKQSELMEILRHFADSVGNKISVNNISNETGLDRKTVDAYIEYLEEFFLIYRCQHYSSSAANSRKQPMAYVTDAGHYNALVGTSPETYPIPEQEGKNLEIVVCDHLRRLQFNFSNCRDTEVMYSELTGEVDFVIDGPGYTLPVEVKRGDSRDANLRALRRFIDEQDLGMGFAVNHSGALEQDGKIVHVPSWLFCYLC
jgi:predicted AAA+ superfamily ATPase